MLISKTGTLTKNIIGLGKVTFSGKGPMRGHYVFLTEKYRNLYGQFLFQLLERLRFHTGTGTCSARNLFVSAENINVNRDAGVLGILTCTLCTSTQSCALICA